MKKVLLLLAAVGCMMMANAQVNLLVNGQTYEPNSKIAVSVDEENVTDMDGVAMITIDVKNITNSDMNNVTVTASIINAPGFTIKSMCAGVCAEGATSPEFNIPANSVYDQSVFADFLIDPSALASDKKGLFKLTVNTPSGAVDFNLEITYVPANAGINDVEMNSIKVWPNPVVSELNVKCEGANEVVVLNVEGKVMQRVMVNGAEEIKINMNHYADGIYMCGIIKDGVLNGVKRVVKY